MPWVPIAVVVADALLFAGSRGRWWEAVPYGLLAAGVVLLGQRSKAASFVAAVVLATLGGAGFVLLPWASYRAGQAVVSRTAWAVIAGAGAGGAAGQVAIGLVDEPQGNVVPKVVTLFLIFVVVPLLVGRYLEQQRRMVRHLRWSRDLMAERERLDERLRIARDMHDSLGHRLSVVSMQAAALEVADDLQPAHREAVQRLAGSARGALDELYDLVGALRGDDPGARTPGVEAVEPLVAERRAGGAPVTWAWHGVPGRVSAAAGQAVYRVVEEGLTNAAKHAPGQPVAVTLAWEPDSLLVRVTNPVVGPEPAAGSGGFGLGGLDERVRAAGGMLRHGRAGERFSVLAMLPTVPDDLEPQRPVATARAVTLGGVIAILIFVVVPLAMVTGVR